MTHKRIIYNQESNSGKSFLCPWLNDIVMPVDKDKIKSLAGRILANGKVDMNKYAGGGPETRHHNGRDYTLDEYKNEKRNEIIGAAVDKALSRKYGVAPRVGDPSCLYTVTDNFGRKYRVAGNQSFMADPGRYGFIVNGPLDDSGVGDIYQYIDKGGTPYHAVLITGYGEDGKPLVSYSSGSAPRYNPDDIMSPLVQSEARERKFNIFSPEEFDGIQSPAKTYDDYFKSVMRDYSDVMASDYKRNKRLWGDENQPVEPNDFVDGAPSYAYETYRFVGTPDDNSRWETEYGSLPKSIGSLPRVDVSLPVVSRLGKDGLVRGYSGGGDIPPQRDNTATRYSKSMAYVPSKVHSDDLKIDLDYDMDPFANIDLSALPEYPGTDDVKDFFSTFAKSAGMDAIKKNQKEYISKRYPYYKEISDSDIDESFVRISNLMSGSGDDKILDLGDLGSVMSRNFGQRIIGVSDKNWSPYYGYSRVPMDFTLAHEISHDSDTIMPGNDLISRENKGAERNGHDERVNEKRADINGVRYLLYKNGIIDQRGGGKVKKHHIRKLRKLYPGLRPLVQMDDEQIASMLNLIADSGNGVDMSNIASDGGFLRKYEGGGPVGDDDPEFIGPPTPRDIAVRNNTRRFYSDMYNNIASKYDEKYPNIAYFIRNSGKLRGERYGRNEADFLYYNNGDLINLTGTKSSNVPVAKSVLDSLALYGAKSGVSPYVAFGLPAQESRFGFYPTAFWNPEDMREYVKSNPRGYALDDNGSGVTPVELFNDAAYANEPYGNTISYVAKKLGVGYPTTDSTYDLRGDLTDEQLSKVEAELAKGRDYADRQAAKLGEPGNIFEHAFNLYKSGKYNPGDPNYSSMVEKAGMDVFSSPEFIDWWNKSGRKYYETYAPEILNGFDNGGDIHIKESHKGLFTAKAKRAGRSVQEHASHVLANKEDYPSSTVKQAAFAKAASKWHSDGGAINKVFESGDLDLLRAAVNNVMKKKISGK